MASPQEENRRKAMREVEMQIFAMFQSRMAVRKATRNGLKEWANSLNVSSFLAQICQTFCKQQR
jgi:hypothetical protein